MTEAKRPIRVFLCHASQDKPAVRGLYKRLNAEGWIDPWLDEEKLLPGQDWEVEIRKAVREADAIVVFISNHSKTKEGFVQKEIKFALDIADEKPEGTIYIIPARLEECDLPDRLKRWHWVNLYDTKGFNRLQASLQRRANALDLEVTPERKSWLERFFKYLGERKEIIFSTLGILVALLALLFGDNIYEQITGRSIFATKPVPTLTSTASFTFQPITPSYTFEAIQPSKTPTISVTATRSSTPTVTPLPTEITDAKGVQMVLVPGGKFIMGSEDGGEDEKPVRDVYLDTFYIDKFEVTNSLYKACVDTGVCTSPNLPKDVEGRTYYGKAQFDDYPVTYVNWGQADIYCSWREAKLPTEAQWEKAARGTDGRTFPWGESIDCNLANYIPSCVGGITKVGSYESGKSSYGIYDLAGNVWEWVADWYSPTFYQNGPTSNPLGPNNGEFRILRGGAWNADISKTRAANRFNLSSIYYYQEFYGTYIPYWRDYYAYYTGFRCAKDVP